MVGAAGWARPDLLVLVVGTATEVGKTWMTAAVARTLREGGDSVAARKPAQSFEPGDDAARITDADVLGAATGEAREVVCPRHRWYEVPMAPPMAAEVLGRAPLTIGELAEETVWPTGAAFGFVETAGGVCSPLAGDGDAVALARAIEPDLVLVVADASLGVINAVRCSVGPLAPLATLVVLNRFVAGDDLHERNRAWLVERDGLAVAVGPAEAAAAIATRRRARLTP